MDAIVALSDDINQLIDLIPAKFYIQENEPQVPNSKYIFNKKTIKENNQTFAQMKKLQKTAKLDPAIDHSTTAKKVAQSADDSGNGHADDNNLQTENGVKSVSSSSQTPSMEELRARLNSRIEELRSQRKADGDSKRKRRQKDKKEQSSKKQKSSGNMQKGAHATAVETTAATAGSSAEQTSSSVTVSSSSEVAFNKIEIGDGTVVKSVDRIAKASKKQKINPKQALEKVQAQETKIKQLEAVDAQKASEMKEQQKWSTVLKKADGQKVQTDANLLKKSAKKLEKQKQKSKKDWDKRLKAVKKGIAMKAKKRQENLDNRKAQKKTKSKKGRE
ncbi:hypothetical protein MP228_001249 [Amoeboaphelidium protococcarum]|nr:hypothetical protein MP228_001249 [Amoeboaphelidium protococcarum]